MIYEQLKVAGLEEFMSASQTLRLKRSGKLG